MDNRSRSLFFMLSFFVQAAVTAGAADHTLVADGGWCWFADPRGLYYHNTNERTFYGWINAGGEVNVAQYDHATGVTSYATVCSNLEIDDHDNPSILIRASDRRVMVFYSRHTTEPRLYYRVSTNPEDITSFSSEQQVTGITANVTYPTPFQLADESNRIYLFWRGIGWQPTYATSDNGGSTWNTPRQLIQGADRPYVKYESDNRSRIHFAFTDGHPRENPSNRIYYACYYNGGYYRANGTLIKLLSAGYLNTSEAEVVYNAASGRGWIWDIALDSLGRPVLVYTALPAETNHRYRYTRWTGSAWRDGELCAAGGWFPETWPGSSESEPHYSGGIVLDHTNPSVVYLSRPVSGVFEIEKWVSNDNGVTWPSQTAVTSGSVVNNIRPYVIRNHPQNGFELMWLNGHYRHYTDYHTAIKTDFTVNDPLPTISLRFDFGIVGFPAAGYTRARAGRRYFAGSFGWLDTTGNRASNRSGATLPNADLVFNSAPRTWRVDLHNGSYSVTVTIGDRSYPHDLITVSANGTVLASNVSTSAGSYYTNTAIVSVTNGTMSFDFSDNGGSDANWVINAIAIQPQATAVRRNSPAVYRSGHYKNSATIAIQNKSRIRLLPPGDPGEGPVFVTLYDLKGRMAYDVSARDGIIDLRQAGTVPAGVYIAIIRRKTR
jgi:hypothetical protein